MKVVVIGSGVIGVTSAYYLAKSGFDVTVLDRQSGPALETSYANAGQISPGYSSPWAAPGIPLKAVKWLFQKHAPLVLRPQLDPAQWRWLLQMLRNCTAERYALNKGRMVRIAEYSRDKLKELRGETGITYDEGVGGTLQLFRNAEQLEGAQNDIAVLRSYGVPYEELDVEGCVNVEPGLAAVREKIVGGLRLPGDETGNCYLFTTRLADRAAELGVTFAYDTKIVSLQSSGDKIDGVLTDKGTVTADRYVLAAGSFSKGIAEAVGVRLPIYPVKGYSLTIPIADPENAPRSTMMDESYKIAITRLGDCIRVGGTAELSGYNDCMPPQRRSTLEHSFTDLFPGVGRLEEATLWTGMRPMTPDSTPIIGPTRYGNLYVNSGHGTLGWTMACGSAQVTADLISGKTPDIDTADLGPARYL